jgi:hypothetical protein
MKRKLIFALSLAIAFTIGGSSDRVLSHITTPQVSEPIQTDLCFYAKNSRLFVGREFAMTAEIRTGMEGASLTSSACPDTSVVFKLPQTPSAELSTIGRHTRTFDHSVIQVTFEGTTIHKTLLLRLREHFQPPPPDWAHEIIVMNRIIAVDVKE